MCKRCTPGSFFPLDGLLQALERMDGAFFEQPVLTSVLLAVSVYWFANARCLAIFLFLVLAIFAIFCAPLVLPGIDEGVVFLWGCLQPGSVSQCPQNPTWNWPASRTAFSIPPWSCSARWQCVWGLASIVVGLGMPG